MQTFTIANLKISAALSSRNRICYILYPVDSLEGLIEEAARKFGITIVMVAGMDWDDDLTPWPAKGEPPGCPDFKGNGQSFLSKLTDTVLPETEKRLNMAKDTERTLAGVSLSGLFTLWQWMLNDSFYNIISLSGSFWYDGFAEWIQSQPLPHKTGKAYFLLGDKEANTNIKAFQPVQTDTVEIVKYLQSGGITTRFELVPGNHYQNGDQRLRKALAWMFG